MGNNDPSGAPPPNAAPPENAGGNGAPNDQTVAQNWIDGFVEETRSDIAHLKEAIAQLAQVQPRGSSNAGPATSQPSRAPEAGAPAQGSSNPNAQSSQPGQPSGPASSGQSKPEQAPKPAHWYFKQLFGG